MHNDLVPVVKTNLKITLLTIPGVGTGTIGGRNFKTKLRYRSFKVHVNDEGFSELIFWLTLQQPNDACAFCPPFSYTTGYPTIPISIPNCDCTRKIENAKFYHNSTRNVCKGLTHSFLK